MGEHGVEDGQLIFKLHGAEVVVGGLGKGAAAHAGAAIVGVEDGEAVLGEELVEEQARRPSDRATPAGRGRRRDSRSAGRWPGWLCRREAEGGVEGGAVVRFDLTSCWARGGRRDRAACVAQKSVQALPARA